LIELTMWISMKQVSRLLRTKSEHNKNTDGIDCVVIDSFSARVDMVEQVHNFSSGRVLVKGVIRHDFYSIFEQLEINKKGLDITWKI
jgi:hypothetical protein